MKQLTRYSRRGKMILDRDSDEKRHYESLTSYFKSLVTYTLTAISIVTAVAIYFTYQNMSEVRTEVRSYLLESKEEVNSQIKDTKGAIEIIDNEAQESIARFKDDIKSFAIVETEKKVREAVDNPTMQALLVATLKDNYQNILNVELSRVQKQIKLIALISSTTESVTKLGDKKGLALLDSLSKFNEDIFIKTAADSVYNKKIKDYRVYYDQWYKNSSLEKLLSEIGIKYKDYKDNQSELIKKTMFVINNSDDLNDIAKAIICLETIANKKFNMFDFTQINSWYQNNR